MRHTWEAGPGRRRAWFGWLLPIFPEGWIAFRLVQGDYQWAVVSVCLVAIITINAVSLRRWLRTASSVDLDEAVMVLRCPLRTCVVRLEDLTGVGRLPAWKGRQPYVDSARGRLFISVPSGVDGLLLELRHRRPDLAVQGLRYRAWV
jgi:hypothetical protein